MMRSIFDGYLTPGCATCPDWADGSDPTRGFGCAAHFPIAECPHFAEAMEEDEKKLHKCKNCRFYDKQTKLCGLHEKYTSRKSCCASFSLDIFREV